MVWHQPIIRTACPVGGWEEASLWEGMKLRDTSSQCWEGLHRNSQKAQLPPICCIQHWFGFVFPFFPSSIGGKPIQRWLYQEAVRVPGSHTGTLSLGLSQVLEPPWDLQRHRHCCRGVCGCSTSPVGYQQGLLSGSPGAAFPSLLPRGDRVALQS